MQIYDRKTELIELIATLESDLQNRLAPKEFSSDFESEMMKKALEKARAELNELTKGQ